MRTIPAPVLFLLLAACGHSPSPTEASFVWTWTPGPSAFVMEKTDNLYEGTAIGSPDVIQDGAVFRMAYAQGGKDHRGRIGMAVSSNGTHWTKNGGGLPVLDVGDSNAWDSWFLDTPGLVKAPDGRYLIYYYGARSNGTPGACIGLASSTDGVAWSRASASPVLTPGPSDAWDGLWVESPVVLWDGNAYAMFYTGVDAKWVVRVGRAVSVDGAHWTKDPANPVLDVGAPGEWDGLAAAVPGVVKKGSVWQLFYCSESLAEGALGMRVPKIGYAWSSDGRSWTRYPGNPILTAWDTYLQPNGPYNPTVLFDEKARRYRMWYETGTGFGMVTAPEIPGI